MKTEFPAGRATGGDSLRSVLPFSFPDNRVVSRDDMHQRIRVIHVINSLEFGGAEAMLCSLLLRGDRRRFDSSVITLIDDMTVAEPIRAGGFQIETMGMRPGVPDPRGLARLALALRRAKPDIVQTWMDHSNLLGGLAARLATRARVVWGLHHSMHVAGMTKRSTLWTVDACAWLSHRVPSRIISCSETTKSVYCRGKFDRERIVVIPNGFDVSRFRPDPLARAEVRREFGIEPDAIVIGHPARFHPTKDHATLINAAAIALKTLPKLRFMLCGDHVNAKNEFLVRHIREAGVGQACVLMGPRRDMPRVYAAMDVLASSSVTEAFPLVLGEAMACGVPCAATDVGDSALIVGPFGRIAPSGDPAALAAAMIELASVDSAHRAALSEGARRRIAERFDLGVVTQRYQAVYEQVLGNAPAPATGDADADEPLAASQRTTPAPSTLNA